MSIYVMHALQQAVCQMPRKSIFKQTHLLWFCAVQIQLLSWSGPNISSSFLLRVRAGCSITPVQARHNRERHESERLCCCHASTWVVLEILGPCTTTSNSSFSLQRPTTHNHNRRSSLLANTHCKPTNSPYLSSV
jgi:hypothetical protein